MADNYEVLAAEIRNLTSVVTKLDKRLDTYMPSQVIELKLKELDVQIVSLRQKDQELELRLDKLKQRGTLQTWLTSSFSAAFALFLAYLISFYLGNR